MAKLDWEKRKRLDNVQRDRVLPPAIEGPSAQRCASCKKYATDVKKYLRAKKPTTPTTRPKMRGKKHRPKSKHNAARVALCPDCAEGRRSRGLIK